LEELRLGYVACTRPRRRLVASAHWWGPTQKKRRGPSTYLLALRSFCDARGLPVGPWADAPADDAANPQLGAVEHIAWPRPLDPAAHRLRLDAARAVRAAMTTSGPVEGLAPDEVVQVAHWDRDIDLLLGELRQFHLPSREAAREVELPASLSATQLLKLAADPAGLARSLVRPMPRPPAPTARRGTRFHAWVESLFAQQPLLEPDDLPGAADHDIVDEADLEQLKQAFLRSPYALRPPHAIEAPFQLVLAGRVVRGRIDAVYETGDGFEVVDWKTNRRATADPLQLAVYRLAWAEIVGLPVERVTAAFLYVRTGEVVRPADLPGREDLERLLSIDDSGGP
jgi:DNA helicase-2/ATP-dependent DNA helicase PcrA